MMLETLQIEILLSTNKWERGGDIEKQTILTTNTTVSPILASRLVIKQSGLGGLID
jgi:hypothetical protein